MSVILSCGHFRWGIIVFHFCRASKLNQLDHLFSVHSQECFLEITQEDILLLKPHVPAFSSSVSTHIFFHMNLLDFFCLTKFWEDQVLSIFPYFFLCPTSKLSIVFILWVDISSKQVRLTKDYYTCSRLPTVWRK